MTPLHQTVDAVSKGPELPWGEVAQVTYILPRSQQSTRSYKEGLPAETRREKVSKVPLNVH